MNRPVQHQRTTMDVKDHLRMISDDLDDTHASLERLINRTPTSENRNKLTDANIFLMQAQAALKGLRL